MRKLIYQILVLGVAVLLMSNSGCDGFLPIQLPDGSSSSPYECLNGYNEYLPGADSLGSIKTKITDTAQYNYILTHSAFGDKYFVVATPNIAAASTYHPLHGKKDRVITYMGTTERFYIDPIQCCGYYMIPEDNTPHSIASIFYDCKTTNRFVTNFHYF